MNIRKLRCCNFILAGLLPVMMVCLPACNTTHKATISGATLRNEKCAEVWLAYPNQPHPMWQEIGEGIRITTSGFAAPTKYKAYKVVEDTLKAFFSEFANNKSDLAIIIPIGAACESFRMRRSGAMSEELQKKYPEIISLQGNGTDNKTADLRLDWSGSQLKGQVIYNGSFYFISPVNSSEGLVYIIYNKEDSGEIKQPFETKPASPGMSTEQKTYDR